MKRIRQTDVIQPALRQALSTVTVTRECTSAAPAKPMARSRQGSVQDGGQISSAAPPALPSLCPLVFQSGKQQGCVCVGLSCAWGTCIQGTVLYCTLNVLLSDEKGYSTVL